MGSNRREFLQFAGLAPAAVATGGFAASGSARTVEVGMLTRSQFLPCVGDEFLFESGPFEAKRAKLKEVRDLHPRDARHEGRFCLVFEPATTGSIVQETYTVAHPVLGRFALFVSPNDAEGRVVEAVFNRL